MESKRKVYLAEGKYQPYVYVLKEVSSGKMYIGCRTEYVNRKCNPSELGETYFSSSKYVSKVWKEYQSTFKVIHIMETPDSSAAIELEEFLINEFNCVFSDAYLNKTNNVDCFLTTGNNYKHSKETKDKISKGNSGKVRTYEQKLKIKIANLGNIVSQETKEKISNSSKGNLNHFYGKKHSEYSKHKVSTSKMGTVSPKKGIPDKQVTCPHCNKSGGRSVMSRWHFDKCKFNFRQA